MLLTLFALQALQAQDKSKEKLALEYYQSAMFDKAGVLFEELYNENPASPFYYEYYFNCMINTDNLEKAASLVKKLGNKYPSDPVYKVDYGYIFKLDNNVKKADKIFEKIENNLEPSEIKIIRTANAFYRRSEFNHAINVYQKGRKLLDNPNAFNSSLARLYQLTRQTGLMMDEYFILLTTQKGMLSSVENMLQDYILDDDEYDIVREKVVSQVQKSDFEPVFVNLLSWLYIQHKDFESAYRQLKALDKRTKNNGLALVQLAEVCIQNKSYDVAGDIYEYMLEKGRTYPYYYQAKFGIIDILYKKVKATADPLPEDLANLEDQYSEFLRLNFYSFIGLAEKVIIRLAEIKAVYLGKTDEAIVLLEKFRQIPQVSLQSKAEMKLALADYYILDGDVWEATLLYQQVAKDFKDHPVGHEAKFRNAKLAFYMGNFQWAADQLDILKASTSELIANDALQLSLLIQDNLMMDTSDAALKMYARADFFYFKHHYDSALLVCDSVLNRFTGHIIEDDVLLLKAKVYEGQKEFNNAVLTYESILDSEADIILKDDACYRAGLLYQEYLDDNQKAFEYFEKIILEYPGSVFSVDARKRYRELKKLLNTESVPDS